METDEGRTTWCLLLFLPRRPVLDPDRLEPILVVHQIDTSCRPLDAAKTTLTDSTLAFVTTGTIEAPVTTSAVPPPSSAALHGVYKRILFAYNELCALR